MALINPSSLYSGGQGILKDNVVDYITQLEQKKTARKDALDKYYMDLPNKINSAGVRKQDLDGLNKRMDKLRNFGMANKEEIRKGGRVAQEYQSMWDENRQYVDESKRVGEFQLKTGQDYFKGKHRVRDKDLAIMQALDQPIDSDEHYKDKVLRLPYGYNDFSIAAPDFDGNRKQQYLKSALGAIKPVYDEKNARIDNNTGEVFIPKKFDQQAIATVADNFANGLKGNVSASNYYEDLLEDKDFVKQASEVISQFTGQKREITTPEDLAAADAIMQLTNSAGEEKIKDPNYAQELKKKMFDYQEGIRQKNREKMANLNDRLIKGRKTASGEEEYEVGFPTQELAAQHGRKLNVDPNILLAEGRKGDPKLTADNIWVFEEDIPEPLMQTINPTDMNKMVYPVQGYSIKQPDGKYKKAFIYNEQTGDLEGKGGRRIGNDNSRDLYIKQYAPTKFKFGAGAKGKITKPGEVSTKKKYNPATGKFE